MHTKKTNNINKLMQISYHSTLTKIQKLQNYKKNIYIYIYILCTDRYLPKIGQYLNRYKMLTFWYQYMYQYSTYQPIWHIQANTGMVLTTLSETEQTMSSQEHPHSYLINIKNLKKNDECKNPQTTISLKSHVAFYPIVLNKILP